MPELPEVETMVRGVRPLMIGRSIRRFAPCACPCKPLDARPALGTISRRLGGRTVLDVRRLGKRIVFEHDDRSLLIIEPRMTGLLLVADAPDADHLRLCWEMEGGGAVWFWDRRGLGTVRYWAQGQASQALEALRLGADALQMTDDAWRQILKGSRPIKTLLLDQSRVAGIGNLYASEILHRAGIHPEEPADRITGACREKLAEAVRFVLEQAIKYEGSTLSDATYRNVLNQAGRYQNEHAVYQREGERCRRCRRGVIVRIVQNQRSTFFCPNCQKRQRLPP
jgi:formamidopyrimidine-DNA glycosylase